MLFASGSTGSENEALINRPKELYDGATPSGNSVSALNLLRLARMTGKIDWEKKADRMVRAFSSDLVDAPMAYTQFLNFLDFFFGPSQEIVIAAARGEPKGEAIVSLIQKRFQPKKALLFKPAGDEGQRISNLCPLAADMRPLEGKATVYICEGYTCKEPLTDPAAIEAALG